MNREKLFTVRLTDDERLRLEAHRVRLGLRAQTDVIRHWIGQEPSGYMVEVARILEREIKPPTPLMANVQVGPVRRAPGSLAKKGR